MMNRMILTGAAATALVASSAVAQVLTFSGDIAGSAEQTGANFSGSVEYVHLGGNDGQLTIDLTNDSPAPVGGFLTGFLFRGSSADGPLLASLSAANPVAFLDTGAVAAGSFGVFDGGAALGGNWQGGGNPSFGLAIGQSGQFVFDIDSAGASLLTTASFLGSVDEPGMVMRFRGLTGGFSDKVPLAVPAPSAMALLALGGLVATRRRR
jgi:hypothetical protein